LIKLLSSIYESGIEFEIKTTLNRFFFKGYYLFCIVEPVLSGRNPGNGRLYLRKTDRYFLRESGNIRDAVSVGRNR
jgi:hypothetical protein